MIRALGLVNTVDANTPVQATVGLHGIAAQRLGCQTIRFHVAPANTGVVYIALADSLNTSPAVDSLKIIAALAAPVDPVEGPFDRVEFSVPNVPAGLNAADFFIVGAASNGVYVSILSQ